MAVVLGIVLTHELIQPNQPYTLTVVNHWNRQGFSPEDVQAIIDHRKHNPVVRYTQEYRAILLQNAHGDIFGNPLQRFKFFATTLNMGDA